ncbi:MAG: chitobiase/beta-hexosaminidase C-terminal domain-containing protein, partial [Candidatus Cellulosilyticum pullistercoris]|nr:chitobiase/beta-hexosaminidase C-terminal domain-containing protein [Candidatus Cellulosilyticum pullistercoris]
MNKRITYLLATLLIAESAMPLSAQSLDGQTRTYPVISTNCLRTTSGGITITPPTTTGPSITVKVDKIYATEIADARAKVDFQLHNVELKEEYTKQAASLHIALESSIALSSITPTGEVTTELIETPGVVMIQNSQNFTYEFTAKNINPDSIRENSYFIFEIPGYLLTTNVNLKVKVFIEQDKVEKPTVSTDSTTSSAIKLVNFNHSSAFSRIFYTLDGSDVTLASRLYDGTPIEVSSSDTIKAVAFIGTMPSEQ